MSLKKLYYNLKFPSSLASVKKLKETSGKNIKDVKKFLHRQNVYTLHKPVRRKFNRRPTYANNIDHIWQADLADMRKVAGKNNKNKFILTCIDIFSKYAWAIPIQNKTGQSIIKCFEKIFRSKRKPKKLQTDKGREFINTPFQNYLKQKSIHFYTSQDNDIKAAIVERFNRTLKNKIYKHFTANQTQKYIDVLPDIVKSYNNSHHSTIGMTPSQASQLKNPKDIAALYSKIYTPKENKKFSKQNFNVGDLVRISVNVNAFNRGYSPNFTHEVFKIYQVHKGTPNMYLLKDLNSEVIEGRFYAEEMVKYNGKIFKNLVQTKKLKSGKYEYLVDYMFHPEEWVSAKIYKKFI